MRIGRGRKRFGDLSSYFVLRVVNTALSEHTLYGFWRSRGHTTSLFLLPSTFPLPTRDTAHPPTILQKQRQHSSHEDTQLHRRTLQGLGAATFFST